MTDKDMKNMGFVRSGYYDDQEKKAFEMVKCSMWACGVGVWVYVICDLIWHMRRGGW